MRLDLIRDVWTARSTTGRLLVDGLPFGFVLEDPDRGLDASMPIGTIQLRKIAGVTAIPTSPPEGYEVAWKWSQKHGADVPWLLNVPGFQAIEIHAGNRPADTLGCQLPGLHRAADIVLDSRVACEWLYPRIKAACAPAAGCRYHISRDAAAWAAWQGQHAA